MSDNKFDKILQEKLKGHQVKLGGPNWADLEKMLNEVDQSANMDREVRNRLQQHTVTYKESHWQILKNKLELEKKLKEKIYFSKIAEFSILALLLFSVFHYNGQNGFDSLKKSSEKQIASIKLDEIIQDQNKQDHHSTDGQGILKIETQDLQQATSTSDIIQASKSNVSQDISLVKNKQSVPTNAHNATIELSNSNVNQLSNSAVHQTFGPLNSDLNSEINSNSSETSQTKKEKTTTEGSTQSDFSIFNKSTVFSDQSKKLQVDKLQSQLFNDTNVENKLQLTIDSRLENSLVVHSNTPSLDLKREFENDQNIASLILMEALATTGSMPLANINITSIPTKNEKWIGAMTGVDINLIRRPIDPNKIKSPENFAVVSLTTGLNYSTKKGRNEFFTGIGFSKKVYDPNFNELIQISDSFYNRDYTLEEYNIIHLPAQYKRHLGESHKLHAYAFGGISMNFVIYTDYKQQDNLRRGQPRSKEILNISASYDDTSKSGLLEGGYYKDNIYFTADVGLGIEKQIQNVKLFFESQYKRNLFSSQLGPRKVKLNSLSFNIGTKYKI